MDEQGPPPRAATSPPPTGTTFAQPQTPAPASHPLNGAPKTTTAGLRITTTPGQNALLTHAADNPTPTQPFLPKASTNIEWGAPLGLHPRAATDEPLVVFRRAIGINSDLAPADPRVEPAEPELGQRHPKNRHYEPTGMYRTVIRQRRRWRWQHFAVSWGLNLVHVAQIIIAATLTALGPNARLNTVPITVLGATNTVIAGMLALLKGQGLPERLHKNEMVYQRLQEWLEETEALLVTGIIGRDNRDIGVLVESAFKMYNSAKLSEENNRPDNYVLDPGSRDLRRNFRAEHSLGGSKADSG